MRWCGELEHYGKARHVGGEDAGLGDEGLNGQRRGRGRQTDSESRAAGRVQGCTAYSRVIRRSYVCFCLMVHDRRTTASPLRTRRPWRRHDAPSAASPPARIRSSGVNSVDRQGEGWGRGTVTTSQDPIIRCEQRGGAEACGRADMFWGRVVGESVRLGSQVTPSARTC